MATLTIEFKDKKNGIDVRIKEVATLKKIAARKEPKLTAAQQLGMESFLALKAAQTIMGGSSSVIET